MNTIIVTGSSGFIGQRIIPFYLKQGIKVVGISRKEFAVGDSNFKGIKCNYDNDHLIEIFENINPDCIIHCASSASVGKSIEDPINDFKSSVEILYNMLFTLKKINTKAKFIFLSSAAVYGNPISLPVNEEDNLFPVSPYGLNKKMCEDICKYFVANCNMNIKILRIFSVFGPGLHKQILWDIHQKLKNNKNELELFGTGNETRDFIYIDDLIDAIDLIIKSDTDEFIFNIANGEEISIKELSELYLKTAEFCKTKIIFNDVAKCGDPLKWRADISKIKKIGYKPKIDIKKGIKNYIEWLKENDL